MTIPPNKMPDPYLIDCRGIMLDCRPGRDAAPHVMGVLNVTPDSFSDAGAFMKPDAALRRVEQMVEEGARIVDVGGESTRPRGRAYGSGAEAVNEEEELRRVLPIVEAVARRHPEVILSVDTYKPSVARRALDAGARIINDVTGLRLTDETARIAAEAGAALVLMHSLGRPGEMPHEHEYGDVVSDVAASLKWSIACAEEAGVRDIVTDPGFGFGKSVEENLKLIRELSAFAALGRPVLVGISRKSTIGVILASQEEPRPVDQRLFGTLGATAVAVLAGAAIVRTHDVAATVDFLQVLKATAFEPSAG